MQILLVILLVLVVALVAVCILLAYRIAKLRSTGTPVLLRRVPAPDDAGWRHGTIHYSDDALRYFRLSALTLGPSVTLPRQAIEIAARRRPMGTELEIMEGLSVLVLEKGSDGHGGGYELALSSGGTTAFQSWVESRAPINSQRRRRRGSARR